MTDILIDDHAEVGALFRALDSAFARSRPREVLEKLDYLWARLAVHIRAEHLHLFPALLAASKGGEAGPAAGAPSPSEVREGIKRLREDHDFFMRELAGAVNAAREVLESTECLREDHDFFMRGLAEAVNGVRVLAAQEGTADAGRLPQIREKVQAVAARLAEHNRIEEGQVYLWQAVLLGEEQRAELRGRMRCEIENLPPRFADDVPGK